MRNNLRTGRSPLQRALVLVAFVLAATTLYFIFGEKNRNPKFAGYLSAKQAGEKSTMVILIQGKPETSMHIRGYTAKLTFDRSKLSVVGIRYKLGVVSEGLGSSNQTLDAVNGSGMIKLMGEAHEQDGASLKGDKLQDIAEVTVRKRSADSSSVTLSPQDGAFYMITGDGRLVKVPMGNSAVVQVE